VFWLVQKWVAIVKEPYVVYLSVRDARTPTRTKLIAGIGMFLVLLYIVNPFDLFPDFLLIGFLDDIIIIPLSIYLIERMIPKPALLESRAKARRLFGPLEVFFTVVSIVLLVLIVLAIAAVAYGVYRLIRG
jgi:uncharacterized membrane protein YkvA (DUF1232 family)